MISAGKATIQVSPVGFIEHAAIQITDHKEMTWTLVTEPVTGESKVFERALLLKELQAQ